MLRKLEHEGAELLLIITSALVNNNLFCTSPYQSSGKGAAVGTGVRRGPSAWGTEQGTRVSVPLALPAHGAARPAVHGHIRNRLHPAAIGTGRAGLAVLQAAQGQSKSAPAAHPPRNPEPYVRAALSACHQGSSSRRAASESSRSQRVGEPASPGVGVAQLLHLCLLQVVRTTRATGCACLPCDARSAAESGPARSRRGLGFAGRFGMLFPCVVKCFHPAKLSGRCCWVCRTCCLCYSAALAGSRLHHVL